MLTSKLAATVQSAQTTIPPNRRFMLCSCQVYNFYCLKIKDKKYYPLQRIILNISNFNPYYLLALYFYRNIILVSAFINRFRSRLSSIELIMKSFSVKHNLQELLLGLPRTMRNIFHLIEVTILSFFNAQM